MVGVVAAAPWFPRALRVRRRVAVTAVATAALAALTSALGADLAKAACVTAVFVLGCAQWCWDGVLDEVTSARELAGLPPLAARRRARLSPLPRSRYFLAAVRDPFSRAVLRESDVDLDAAWDRVATRLRRRA